MIMTLRCTKIDHVKQTQRKLDSMLYELSLSRKSSTATGDDGPPEEGKGDDNDS